MPRVPCPECAFDVVVDPSGRCPEGHLVVPPAPEASAPEASASEASAPDAHFDDLGELAALTDALDGPSAAARDEAADDVTDGDEGDDLDPVFARFAELMREREPTPEQERDDEPFTIWNGPDDVTTTTDEDTDHPARPTTPDPAPTEDEPLFPATTAPPPEPQATDIGDDSTDLPAELAGSDEPSRDDDAQHDDAQHDVDPTQDVGTGPPLAPLKDGWVGFTARSKPTEGKRRRR